MRLPISNIMALMFLAWSTQAALAVDCKLTVNFGLDKADLSPEMQLVLLNFMRHNPKAHGTVVGYTDALASQAYNIDLSRRRALSVIQFIEQYNANAVQVEAGWRGKLDPVINTKGAELLNRRVEINYHGCTPVNFFMPMPVELRGYETMSVGAPSYSNGGGGSVAVAGGGSAAASGGGSSAAAGGGSAAASGGGSSAAAGGGSAAASGGGSSAAAGGGGAAASGGGSSAAAGGGSASVGG